eukprot:NODE_124_length_18806_cov_0.323996.p11 type:complete len:100 gc:universal NODE_124_length_18806_cov_0.323996:13816-13517(-)
MVSTFLDIISMFFSVSCRNLFTKREISSGWERLIMFTKPLIVLKVRKAFCEYERLTKFIFLTIYHELYDNVLFKRFCLSQRRFLLFQWRRGYEKHWKYS